MCFNKKKVFAYIKIFIQKKWLFFFLEKCSIKINLTLAYKKNWKKEENETTEFGFPCLLKFTVYSVDKDRDDMSLIWGSD